MSATAAIVGAIASAIAAAGAATSSISTTAKGKKALARQVASQKELMDYQNALQRQNLEDQRDYQYDYEMNYFQRQREAAERGGFAPEAALGATGSGGTASGSGGVSIPLAPDVPISDPGQTIAGIGDSILQASTAVNQLQKNSDEAKSRRYALEAQEIENNKKRVELAREVEALDDDRWRAGKRDIRFGWEESAANRSAEAFDLDMKDKRANFVRNATEDERNRYRFLNEVRSNELQYWLGRENLTEQQWRRQYRERYGKNPERSMSLADFLNELGTDVLDMRPGQAVASAVDSVVDVGKKFVKNLPDRGPELVQRLFDGNESFTGGSRFRAMLRKVFSRSKK